VLEIKIIALASVNKKGNMNLPKEIRDILKIIDDRSKIIFLLDDSGRVYIEKA